MGSDEVHRTVLRQHFKTAVDTLSITHTLLAALFSEEIFTEDLIEQVLAQRTRSEKVFELLKILSRRGESAFCKFVDIIRPDHKELSDLLWGTYQQLKTGQHASKRNHSHLVDASCSPIPGKCQHVEVSCSPIPGRSCEYAEVGCSPMPSEAVMIENSCSPMGLLPVSQDEDLYLCQSNSILNRGTALTLLLPAEHLPEQDNTHDRDSDDVDMASAKNSPLSKSVFTRAPWYQEGEGDTREASSQEQLPDNVPGNDNDKDNEGMTNTLLLYEEFLKSTYQKVAKQVDERGPEYESNEDGFLCMIEEIDKGIDLVVQERDRNQTAVEEAFKALGLTPKYKAMPSLAKVIKQKIRTLEEDNERTTDDVYDLSQRTERQKKLILNLEKEKQDLQAYQEKILCERDVILAEKDRAIEELERKVAELQEQKKRVPLSPRKPPNTTTKAGKSPYQSGSPPFSPRRQAPRGRGTVTNQKLSFPMYRK